LHVIIAGLLHDVASAPFAHTAEYVLKDFDHELETHNILSGKISGDAFPDLAVFGSELPRLHSACMTLSGIRGTDVDPEEIARMVLGQGELGYVISGTLDLDNADNVTRACLYMGMEVDRRLPMRLAEWLARQKAPPVELSRVRNPDVQLWRDYRRRLYSAFFDASDEESGREAFLQHLMRRAVEERIPRRLLVWNTDEGLLSAMATLGRESNERGRASLADLVRRYRLMERTHRILSVPIEDEETLRVLKLPQATGWIEKQLSSPSIEPFVVVAARRFSRELETLFATSSTPPLGVLSAFKLGDMPERKQLPEWLQSAVAKDVSGAELRGALAEVVAKKIPVWVRERPWLNSDGRDDGQIANVLDTVGDWSFRLSRNDNFRNESFHSYPSTFLYAIPASLINALGLKGELVVDPFGGTGQTLIEVIKYGGSGVSGDANSVATLVARSRVTFLSSVRREYLRSISRDDVSACNSNDPPEFPLRDQWHHQRTLEELTAIRSFIAEREDAVVAQFLKSCLSAILTSMTARKGEQHGFFADNTPLGSKQQSPPFRPAIEYFINRIETNLRQVERLYAFLERLDRDPEAELRRARVVRRDARKAAPEDYGVAPKSVAAIITSPPYLCTTDYSLGLRLSYYWLDLEEALNEDYAAEIGARRQRFSPDRAFEAYLESLSLFSARAAEIVRVGGYLAMVLGVSEAEAFRDRNVLDVIDKQLEASGFSRKWSKWRPIHWNRNYGYRRVREERVAVYVMR
jgi:hypothetical protein